MTVDMGAVCPREPIENRGARLQLERCWPAPTLVWRIHAGPGVGQDAQIGPAVGELRRRAIPSRWGQA